MNSTPISKRLLVKKRVLMVMMALATGFCLDNTQAEDLPEGTLPENPLS